MPELFVEFFSEEIPARMQARAADDLVRLLGEALTALSSSGFRSWHGMRRIAASCAVAAEVPAAVVLERGPRASAPEAALAGFLRKHGASREDLIREGDYWVLSRRAGARPAASVIAGALPGLIRRFPWPKSMRWGTSNLLWVRPLRRIVCLLDGAVVPFDLRDGEDDGHGLVSEDTTEGHRFLAPGAFAVRGAEDWAAGLRARRVLVDADERKRVIWDGLAALAAAKGLSVVEDAGLLDEVAGLAEWPVPLLGRIDESFMDLPQEVMRVSMRVNQRNFALRDAGGVAAPWFGFVANIEPTDGGAATVAGNERVLRARFADARHFWDLDRKVRLAERLPALDGVVFHAKLGTQGDRARRLERLAGYIASSVGADPVAAARAGLLAKADLVTGMVGEFPELQGVMGGYYARHDREADAVVNAIRTQYEPPETIFHLAVFGRPVALALGLADRLDQLAQFFAIGEVPTGSGDPFALRRAAIALIRLILGLELRLPLRRILNEAGADDTDAIISFIVERWRVLMRSDGQRHDIIAAVFAAHSNDDLWLLRDWVARTTAYVSSSRGADLLAGYRRAANIVRIEERKDGPFNVPVDRALLVQDAERSLFEAASSMARLSEEALSFEHFDEALDHLAILRRPLDAFFDTVRVNEEPYRRNRLALLTVVVLAMNRVADFSLIEG